MKTTAIHFSLVCVLLCALLGAAQTPSPEKPLTKEQIASSRFRVDTLGCGNGRGGLVARPGETILLPDKGRNWGIYYDDPRIDGCMVFGLNTQKQCQGKKVELTCQCYLRASSPWSVNPADNFEVDCTKEYTVNGYNQHSEHELARREAARKQQEAAQIAATEAEARAARKAGHVVCMSGDRPTELIILPRGVDASHCPAPKQKGATPWE